MLSDAPTRANTRSTIGSLAARAGDERARLRHQAEQRRLAQVGRLAAHVGPGQDDQLMRGASSVTSFGTNAPADVPLDDRDGATSVATSSSPACISGFV